MTPRRHFLSGAALLGAAAASVATPALAALPAAPAKEQ